MQQQQQMGYYSGPLRDKISTIVNLFQRCGGRSAEYQDALSKLPHDAAPHLQAAINQHIKLRQQQEQQCQM